MLRRFGEVDTNLHLNHSNFFNWLLICFRFCTFFRRLQRFRFFLRFLFDCFNDKFFLRYRSNSAMLDKIWSGYHENAYSPGFRTVITSSTISFRIVFHTNSTRSPSWLSSFSHSSSLKNFNNWLRLASSSCLQYSKLPKLSKILMDSASQSIRKSPVEAIVHFYTAVFNE